MSHQQLRSQQKMMKRQSQLLRSALWSFRMNSRLKTTRRLNQQQESLQRGGLWVNLPTSKLAKPHQKQPSQIRTPDETLIPSQKAMATTTTTVVSRPFLSICAKLFSNNCRRFSRVSTCPRSILPWPHRTMVPSAWTISNSSWLLPRLPRQPSSRELVPIRTPISSVYWTRLRCWHLSWVLRHVRLPLLLIRKVGDNIFSCLNRFLLIVWIDSIFD